MYRTVTREYYIPNGVKKRLLQTFVYIMVGIGIWFTHTTFSVGIYSSTFCTKVLGIFLSACSFLTLIGFVFSFRKGLRRALSGIALGCGFIVFCVALGSVECVIPLESLELQILYPSSAVGKLVIFGSYSLWCGCMGIYHSFFLWPPPHEESLFVLIFRKELFYYYEYSPVFEGSEEKA